MAPPTDPQRYAKFAFARGLAERLEEAAAAGGRFARLILVAAPRTLGDLRELSPARSRPRSWPRSTRT